MSDFAERLLRWFDDHGRKDLPWQFNCTPYRVWVSEIMLQQTQVQTVIPYYERFMTAFPDVEALAAAPVDEVLSLWSGLGYYARGRNLHRAAQMVRDDFHGQFPDSLEAMMSLPGIGRSTAGAILSIACGQRHAILDGNVKRVLARHSAVEGWPGRTAVANALWDVAETHTPAERVADYTQAIMDLGATLCTRSRPDCAACPVNADCKALAADAVAAYPGKKPRRDKPLKKTTMVIAVTDRAVYLERRPASGIWGGLWSLPEVDSVENWYQQFAGTPPADSETMDTVRHSFSHYDLDILPVVVRMTGPPSRIADSGDATWYQPGDVPPGGIAAPIQKLIDRLELQTGVPQR